MSHEHIEIGALERKKIIKEIEHISFESYPSNQLFKLRSDQRKFSRIMQTLKAANYQNTDIYDNSFAFYCRVFEVSYFAYILSFKMKILKTCVLLTPIIPFWQFVEKHQSLKKGLYKKAIYGSDEMSQDTRLMLKYFFPKNKYQKVIDDRIEFYKQAKNASQK